MWVYYMDTACSAHIRERNSHGPASHARTHAHTSTHTDTDTDTDIDKDIDIDTDTHTHTHKEGLGGSSFQKKPSAFWVYRGILGISLITKENHLNHLNLLNGPSIHRPHHPSIFHGSIKRSFHQLFEPEAFQCNEPRSMAGSSATRLS